MNPTYDVDKEAMDSYNGVIEEEMNNIREKLNNRRYGSFRAFLKDVHTKIVPVFKEWDRSRFEEAKEKYEQLKRSSLSTYGPIPYKDEDFVYPDDADPTELDSMIRDLSLPRELREEPELIRILATDSAALDTKREMISLIRYADSRLPRETYQN